MIRVGGAGPGPIAGTRHALDAHTESNRNQTPQARRRRPVDPHLAVLTYAHQAVGRPRVLIDTDPAVKIAA